jgi:serine/threonine-protein kinase
MTAAVQQSDDRSGQVLLGKLKLVRLLGQGGMGQVYEVEHLITRHRRALKIMHARYAESQETIARFIREAGVAGTLKTPHVVETYDAGQLEDGSPYVLMELLRGEPLSGLLDSPAPLPAGRLVGIVCQVLEGLCVAHEAGIVHRDVKPDNIFIGRDERHQERVRLLDFGISKFTQGTVDYAGTLTSDGAMMGSPFYMSPEQASGAKAVDERSDLYAVGVILYEGLARRRPFDAMSLPALVIKIHSGDHVPIQEAVPALAPGLGDIVERAMQVDRTLRYASARELLAALVPYADSGYVASLHTLKEAGGSANANTLAAAPVVALPPAPVPRGSEKPAAAPERPAWVVPTASAATVVAVVLAAALVAGHERRRGATHERRRATEHRSAPDQRGGRAHERGRAAVDGRASSRHACASPAHRLAREHRGDAASAPADRRRHPPRPERRLRPVMPARGCPPCPHDGGRDMSLP